jgi:hypothetical protein
LSDETGQITDKTTKTSAMIITIIEYKFAENENFVNLPFRQSSALFQETPQKTAAGILYLSELSFYIAVIDELKQAAMIAANYRPVIFRITDSEGLSTEIGSDAEPAVFTASKRIGPTPGVAYGWDIKITCLSTTPGEMSSFIS